jgi:hypothetical protein
MNIFAKYHYSYWCNALDTNLVLQGNEQQNLLMWNSPLLHINVCSAQ